MAQRLPTPGGDDGTWGNILNSFLEVAHNADGSLQAAAIAQAGGVTTSTAARGDLSGYYPSPNVSKLNGTPLDPTPPTDGQFLTYSQSAGKWGPQTATGTPSLRPSPVPSGMYFTSWVPKVSWQNANLNQITAIPFFLAQPLTINSLGVRASGTSTTGAWVRLGVYTDTDGSPGQLLMDAGQADVSGAAGSYVYLTITNLDLSAGYYWFAAVNQGVAAGLYMSSTAVISSTTGTGIDMGYYPYSDWVLRDDEGPFNCWASSAATFSSGLPTIAPAGAAAQAAITVAAQVA